MRRYPSGLWYWYHLAQGAFAQVLASVIVITDGECSQLEFLFGPLQPLGSTPGAISLDKAMQSIDNITIANGAQPFPVCQVPA